MRTTTMPGKCLLRVALPDLREDGAVELLATLRELIAAIEEHYRHDAVRYYRRCRCEQYLRAQQDLFEHTHPPF